VKDSKQLNHNLKNMKNMFFPSGKQKHIIPKKILNLCEYIKGYAYHDESYFLFWVLIY